MKQFIQKLQKAFAIHIVSNSGSYRYGTHYKIGYGRCYCIEQQNILGNWITVYETDCKSEWNKACNHYC